mgnify:CR=1 FL=1
MTFPRKQNRASGPCRFWRPPRPDAPSGERPAHHLGDVLLADRGFGGFAEFFLLGKRGVFTMADVLGMPMGSHDSKPV